jgi:hypothetical protein
MNDMHEETQILVTTGHLTRKVIVLWGELKLMKKKLHSILFSEMFVA